MIAIAIAAQLVLPLALLLWLASWPATGRLAFGLQVAGIGAVLLALAWVAPWGMLPWWTPRAYGILWFAAALWHLLRGHAARKALRPARRAHRAGMAASMAMLAVGAWLAVAALQGRSPPGGPVVDIANPLGSGRYLVASGGGREIVNAHLRTLDATVERYGPWRGQSFAVDLVGLYRWGTRAAGLRPADPSAYAIFGAPLYAPCTGDVLAVEANMPDLDVPRQDTINRLGNHVILRCGEAVVVLAHLQRASTTVASGQAVVVGEPLGRVGNSGASTEPHLHVHAQRPAAKGEPPISGDPLALRIGGRFLVRNDRLRGSEP